MTFSKQKSTCSQALLGSLIAAFTIGASVSADAQQAPAGRMSAAATENYKLAIHYVTHFYPLWLSSHQARGANRLIGPDRVSPLYKIVVAINVDTLYASTFLDLTAEPVMLTVPATTARYSVLVLDPYGDIFDTAISTQRPGVYALTGPGFSGTVPDGTTQIPLPYNHMVIIFRADKFSSSGEDQMKQAEKFRRSLLMQTETNWESDPTGGATEILPEAVFALPIKTAADMLIASDPITFLEQLQAIVDSDFPPPLSDQEQKLAARFDNEFARRQMDDAFIDGAQTAHTMILDNYLTHTGRTNWVNFLDFGIWNAHEDLDRSGTAEFLQYGNDHNTAAYYHAFVDGLGHPLDGTDPKGYVIHLRADEIPQASRFWSFTIYTPKSIELVRNDAKKYEIASYTPGLRFNADGSLTLYFATALPKGVNQENWAPIPAGPFNIMLRVYGPEGTVLDGTYLPPRVRKR